MTAYQCESCKFWQRTANDLTTGECHVNSPAAGVVAIWPTCRAEDWCGQFQEGSAPLGPATEGPWNLDSSTTRPNGPGIVRFGTGNPANPGTLIVSYTDADGKDQAAWLSQIVADTLITMTQVDDPNDFYEWQATGPFTPGPSGAVYGTVTCGAYAGSVLLAPCPVTLTIASP